MPRTKKAPEAHMPLRKLTNKTRNDDVRYEVIPMTEDMPSKTVEIDGHRMPWGASGGFMTNDKGVADEIQGKYGHRVMTYETKGQWHPSDRGHRYTFPGVQLPWHRYDENGKRIDSGYNKAEEKEGND